MKLSIRLSFVVLLLGFSSALYALDGREIMLRVDGRPTGRTSHALVNMERIDSRGQVSARSVEMFTARDEKDLARLAVVFHSPASVRNTRYLSIEHEGRDDDKWIFLPALRRVRRIAAAERGSSFMGTDFTYDDMAEREVDKDHHRLLREETLGAYSCYVVESIPKDPRDSQYSRRISWVAKDLWIPIKVELYDKNGNLQKIATMERIETLQGFLTPLRMTMRNVQQNTSTVLTMEQFTWNKTLSPGLFTTRFLETGRP